MPFVPFYSSVVHDALVSILEGRQTSSSSSRVIEVETTVGYDEGVDAGLFVRRGGDVDNEDEDDDDDLQSEGSNSTSSLLETLNEEDRQITSIISLTTTGRRIDEFSSATSSSDSNDAPRNHPPKIKESNINNNSRSGGGGNNRKKHESKSIGRAPSTILTFVANHNNDNNNESCSNVADVMLTKMAIEIPTGLFPRPIRTYDDNHNTHQKKQCAMATDLLLSWNKLHGRNSGNNLLSPTIIVILLRSGRFVSAVYTKTITNTAEMTMLAHTTSTRYTVRKGQGGSQSSHDMSKSKAKSVGAQLRREGEKKLREDVYAAWVKFHNCGYVKRCVYVYVSCPKGMKRDYLYSTDDNSGGLVGLGLLVKGDTRWRDIPLDVGRPTLEAASLVLDCVLGCSVRQLSNEEYTTIISSSSEGGGRAGEKVTTSNEERVVSSTTKLEISAPLPPPPPPPPYTPLHDAVMDGDLARLIELLDLLNNTKGESAALPNNNVTDDRTISSFSTTAYDVNTVAGPDLRTPLHMASMLSTNLDAAPGLVTTLLISGHADPTIVDRHGLPPYRTALNETREAYRLARGVLGEDCWAWDDDAKVPSALTSDDIKAKKVKAAEKKRRQRARQKEVKAEEKAEIEAAAEKECQEAMERKQQEDAKRIRDGLRPKLSSTTASNVCDYCQQVFKGKRRSQMFQRLEYAYCSTECVKRHQRELMAAAATAQIVQ